MKEKFLNSLSKSELRDIAKALDIPKCHKMSIAKLKKKIMPHSYNAIVDAI